MAVAERSYIKLDRFELFDIIREFHLAAPEFCVLFALVALADFKTREYKGTAYELAEHTPSNRTGVITACERLARLGLVSFVKPFRQNSFAWIKVDCYERAVVPNARQRSARQASPGSPRRAQDAPPSTPDGTPKEPGGAIDLGKGGLGRDRGDEVVRSVPLCPSCGKPAGYSPLGENCACPF